MANNERCPFADLVRFGSRIILIMIKKKVNFNGMCFLMPFISSRTAFDKNKILFYFKSALRQCILHRFTVKKYLSTNILPREFYSVCVEFGKYKVFAIKSTIYTITGIY